MPVGTAFGKIAIQGKQYNIAPQPGSYKVSESPAHADLDPKLERRIIYKNFSSGISKKSDETSLDATSSTSPSISVIRQVRNASGFHWANGLDTRSMDRIFPQRENIASNFSDDTEQPFKFGDAEVYSWAISQKAVWALLNPPATWIQSVTTTPTITDAIQYGGFLYLGVGNNDDFYTWDQATITTNWVQRTFVGSHFAVIRDQLWRSANASVFSTTDTNPASQVWSTATVVGDPNTDIMDMDVWQDFLMIFKQDGIYNIDKTGNVYSLFPGFRTLGANPRPIGQWRNAYYFASDVGLIWEVSQDGVKRIGFDVSEAFPMGGTPGATTDADMPFLSLPTVLDAPRSRGVAMTNYLIVGFNDITQSSTSGAYFLAWDGASWHPFGFFKNSLAYSIGQTGGNLAPINPVLQFAIQDRATSTNQIFYQPDPLVDPFFGDSFDTNTQEMYFNIDNGVLEDEYKVLERINIGADFFDTGHIRMAYALDEDITNLRYQDMGPPQGDAVQIAQQFNPPRPFPTYRKIALKMTIIPGSDVAPIVRYVIVHYKQRTPQRKVWDIQLLADQDIIGSQGRVDVRNSKKIVSDLDTARQNHTQVEFIDIRNDSHTVYVDEVGEEIANLRGDQSPSFLVTVKLVEASLEEVVDTQ